MGNAPTNVATLPTRVMKRDGREVAFDAGKIESAIRRAGQASGEYGDLESGLLTAQVVKVLAHRFGHGRLPDIEAIQDVVEQTLIAANHFETARSYIVYREQHSRLRDQSRTLVDVAASIDEYLDRSDWRVAANANQGYSLGGLILNTSGKIIANYWLSHVYTPEIGEAHRDGSIHIHDLDMLAGYCAGWSLRTLLNEGLNGVPGRVEAGPPRHMSSAVGQIVNFLGTLQNEWAGAQAFSSFDTYMAPFVRKDGLDYPQVHQFIQELIYNLNVPSRWGSQAPFTNLTFDWVCPEDLREQVPVIAGEEQPFTYGDLQGEMDMINRAYIEVMTAGDAKGRIFTFPIPTYNITPDFPWEGENVDRLFAMTAKYGLPYFCLEENTQVHTREGVKQVADLTLEDMVIGSDGQYKRIVNLVKTTRETLVTITTETGRQVRCSDNHRFPTAAGLKSADTLTLSDELKIAQQQRPERIARIERTHCPTAMVDLEIDSDDHLFVLANGILTHNSNFISSDMDPHMVRSMCCRLRLDVTELLKRGNGLFGSAEQTGSLGVVTINCARLGYLYAGDEEGLLGRLDRLLDLARSSLEIKRKVIQRHMDAGLFPYTKRYLGTLRNHFSTIGVNGINEMIRNFTRDSDDITTDAGLALAIRLLDHIRGRMVEFQEATGHMYNLEATPAEGTTYRFAREDQKRYPDILQAGTREAPYYTNSSQLPVGFTDDPFQALTMQEPLQSRYTGGTVLHLYMNEQVSSVEACKKLVHRALANFRLPYITVTPVFSICPKHGYIPGEHEFCPLCDQELMARQQASNRSHSETENATERTHP